jgi:hypothetical protein
VLGSAERRLVYGCPVNLTEPYTLNTAPPSVAVVRGLPGATDGPRRALKSGTARQLSAVVHHSTKAPTGGPCSTGGPSSSETRFSVRAFPPPPADSLVRVPPPPPSSNPAAGPRFASQVRYRYATPQEAGTFYCLPGPQPTAWNTARCPTAFSPGPPTGALISPPLSPPLSRSLWAPHALSAPPSRSLSAPLSRAPSALLSQGG